MAGGVGQAFQPAGAGDFPVARRGTGKFRAPADKNVCRTGPARATPAQNHCGSGAGWVVETLVIHPENPSKSPSPHPQSAK